MVFKNLPYATFVPTEMDEKLANFEAYLNNFIIIFMLIQLFEDNRIGFKSQKHALNFSIHNSKIMKIDFQKCNFCQFCIRVRRPRNCLTLGLNYTILG